MEGTRFDSESVKRLADRWITSPRKGTLTLHTDTSDFFRIDFNDVLILNGHPYLVRHNAREGRFGLDDEVKFWVKRAIDLSTEETKIIKLVFYEKFTTQIGEVRFECFRSPRKEARILDLVRGHPHFMQGFSVLDERENIVRVVDFIWGQTLAAYVESLDLSHEAYFFSFLPDILDHFIQCVEAVSFLHENGEKHGDIRRDHILLDRESRCFRWIDFDYNYRHRENIYGYDLFGLGNVLIHLAGKGDVLIPQLRQRNDPVLSRIEDVDLNIVFHHRIANLRKIYPYIPEPLNRVLCHFAKGTKWFYETTGQFLEELREARSDLGKDGAAVFK